jgi:hypothetical protein
LLYKINRDVPANTTAAAPDWQKLQVTKGTIKEWIIFCPEECADLMKFKVEYQGVQILPISRDEWMDALMIPFPIMENLNLDVAPYVLDIRAYNLDTKHSHEYNLYVDILRDEAFTPQAPGFNIKTAWSKVFGGGA